VSKSNGSGPSPTGKAQKKWTDKKKKKKNLTPEQEIKKKKMLARQAVREANRPVIARYVEGSKADVKKSTSIRGRGELGATLHMLLDVDDDPVCYEGVTYANPAIFQWYVLLTSLASSTGTTVQYALGRTCPTFITKDKCTVFQYVSGLPKDQMQYVFQRKITEEVRKHIKALKTSYSIVLIHGPPGVGKYYVEAYAPAAEEVRLRKRQCHLLHDLNREAEVFMARHEQEKQNREAKRERKGVYGAQEFTPVQRIGGFEDGDPYTVSLSDNARKMISIKYPTGVPAGYLDRLMNRRPNKSQLQLRTGYVRMDDIAQFHPLNIDECIAQALNDDIVASSRLLRDRLNREEVAAARGISFVSADTFMNLQATKKTLPT